MVQRFGGMDLMKRGYKEKAFYQKKSDALKTAREYRKKGHNARVVGGTANWFVYVRR